MAGIGTSGKSNYDRLPEFCASMDKDTTGGRTASADFDDENQASRVQTLRG